VSDPLFVHVAGGVVPSIDTVYRDLRRFDDEAIADLEALVAEHGLAAVRAKRRPVLHLDIDTTVEPVFGGLAEVALVPMVLPSPAATGQGLALAGRF
jgi:hypothetical protein